MSNEDLSRRIAERCATCAFRPGTDAANSPLTQLKVKLCIMAGKYFICHESPLEAWCAGIADAITAKFHKDGTVGSDAWKEKVANELLDVIDEVERTKDLSLLSAESVNARIMALAE